MSDGGKRILAIDQGTTGTAAFVFDERAAIVGHADEEFGQHFPKPGWVEHDAEEIWQTTQAVVRAALKAARAEPRDVAAIGITNQRETSVVWDARTGHSLARAIVWQDRRTAARCEKLAKDGWAPTVRRKTGLVIDAYFSATKVEWLLRNVPSVRAAAKDGRARFGTMDAWLVHKLTNGATHATDASNASRTLLFDINRLRWDSELLREFKVPETMLPEVVPSSGVVGWTDESAFGARVPIAGMAGDQQSALFGQACFREGQAKNTYGTGSFLLMNTGAKRVASKRLLSTIAWKIGDRTEYALEGSVFTTGASVQWLRDGLGLIASAAETEALATSVPDSGGVVFVPALQGLGAPWWDQRARGAVLGISRATTKAHLARAVLEATAFRMRDVADAMVEDSKVKLKGLRVDGGGSMNGFLMQFQSDVLGAPVERPVVTETTALGAAYLAGLGADVWRSREEIAQGWRLDRRFEPAMPKRERDARYAKWLDALDRARAWETG